MNKIQQIARRPDVKAVLTRFQQNLAEVTELALEIQQIPSPTFYEKRRADFVQSQFSQIGLQDVEQDDLHNVFARFRGKGKGAPLVVSAHLDTVFAADTDLSVTRNGERISGPGIADNSLGVAGLLALARAFQELNANVKRDVWFVSNVGEEGLGDLCGMRAVVSRFGTRGQYVVLEGGLFGYVCHEAIGVRRYRISVEGPGGHSWGSFGTPSATHVLGGLIAELVQLKVPANPKTTYNIGVIEGGTTVNSIARNASMLLDLRSEDADALGEVVQQVERIVERQERPKDVSIRLETIGSRPAGQIGRQTPLVRWAVDALKEVGCKDLEFTVASTDANIPLSNGLPAVCIGLSRSGNTHRPDEYVDVGPIPAGLGQALLLTLAASGLEE